MSDRTTLPIKKEMRDNILRPLKTKGQTYDELLREMASDYEPEIPDVEVTT